MNRARLALLVLAVSCASPSPEERAALRCGGSEECAWPLYLCVLIDGQGRCLPVRGGRSIAAPCPVSAPCCSEFAVGPDGTVRNQQSPFWAPDSPCVCLPFYDRRWCRAPFSVQP